MNPFPDASQPVSWTTGLGSRTFVDPTMIVSALEHLTDPGKPRRSVAMPLAATGADVWIELSASLSSGSAGSPQDAMLPSPELRSGAGLTSSSIEKAGVPSADARSHPLAMNLHAITCRAVGIRYGEVWGEQSVDRLSCRTRGVGL